MPSLFDVANHFDDIQVYDAYTSAPLFKAQTSTFLGASPDGSVANKRVFSLAPALGLPARGAVTAIGESYILGTGILDGFAGASIRRSVWTRMVTDTFSLLTPAQAVLASAGVDAFGHKTYLKDTVNGVSDAEYDPFWEIFFAKGEPIAKGTFLKTPSAYYRVRSSYVDDAGFIVASSDELDPTSRVSVVFPQQGAYDPVTDSYASTVVNTFGFLLDRYKLYDMLSKADATNSAGDMTLVVAASAVTPVVGRRLTIGTQSWAILTATPEQDAWALHIRRA
jgi:hypothetical protein